MLLALAYAAIDAANKLEKEKNDLSESMTDDSTNSIDVSCKGILIFDKVIELCHSVIQQKR